MQLPAIHSNGTGRADLIEGYHAASRAIQAAMDALRAIEFNARDYYVAGPDAWTTARDEMITRHNALNGIKSDLDTITLHCVDARR